MVWWSQPFEHVLARWKVLWIPVEIGQFVGGFYCEAELQGEQGNSQESCVLALGYLRLDSTGPDWNAIEKRTTRLEATNPMQT